MHGREESRVVDTRISVVDTSKFLESQYLFDTAIQEKKQKKKHVLLKSLGHFI